MLAELRPAPRDSVSAVAFSPSLAKNVLACASWDQTLRFYDADSSELLSQQDLGSPLLDCAFVGEFNKVAVAALNGSVQLFDFQAGQTSTLGKHDAPVRIVRYHRSSNLVFTGGWDRTVRAWDLRSPRQVGICCLHGKVYAMDLNDERLVVSDSLKRTYIYDIREGPELLHPELRDQILKYQIRCLRCFPNGQGFAGASIEGRVTWEYFDPSPEVQAKKYAFKCHRTKGSSLKGCFFAEADGSELVYPVNAVVFHPRHGTFATGGSDGGVSLWDGIAKKRLSRLPPLASRNCSGACEFEFRSVSSLAFNPSGTLLAMAVSYLHENGAMPNPPAPQVIVRAVKEEDVKPKA